MTKEEFYKTWLNHFAFGISKEDISKYVVSTGNFLWHIFSFNLLDGSCFLTGDQAKAAYDAADKQDAIYIDWFGDDESKKITSQMRTADSLNKRLEVYVAASDFSWTYIKTHESSCGPYFMRLCGAKHPNWD